MTTAEAMGDEGRTDKAGGPALTEDVLREVAQEADKNGVRIWLDRLGFFLEKRERIGDKVYKLQRLIGYRDVGHGGAEVFLHVIGRMIEEWKRGVP